MSILKQETMELYSSRLRCVMCEYGGEMTVVKSQLFGD